MMQIVTGVQTTGSPHLGNIIGAIIPGIQAGGGSLMPPVYVVADMHSMLTVADRQLRRENTKRVTATWIAFGAARNGLLYRQSHVPQLSQVAMLLSGTASMAAVMEGDMKPKVFENIHLVLMAADLLMLRTTHIPVGQDSREHIAIVRDTALRFNGVYGDVLVVPEGLIDDCRPTVPGTDGRKMSKSFDNCIDVLAGPAAIRVAVEKIPVPQNIASSNEDVSYDVLVKLFQAIGADAGLAEIGSGDRAFVTARNRLIELLVERFRPQREEFDRLMADPPHLYSMLAYGEDWVREMAAKTVDVMKVAMGMS